jgi:hypothetical protein
MLLFSFPAFYITGYVLAPIIAVGFNVGLYLALYAFGVLILFQRFIKKVKLHYLLAYPGEPDEYPPVSLSTDLLSRTCGSIPSTSRRRGKVKSD